MLSVTCQRFRSFIAIFILAVACLPPNSVAARDLGAPADTAAIGKVRWAYYVPYAANSLESLRQSIGNLSHLSPYWYEMDGEGNLVSTTSEVADRNKDEVLQLARSNRVKVLPMIKNSATYADFHPVLADEALRKKAINQIVKATADNSYAGAQIDFEGLDGEDRPYLTGFMSELAVALRQAGKMVTQAVAAKDAERTTGWAGAYDYAALAPSNDLIVLMTYGYGVSQPQSTAPYPWVQRSVAFASSQIPSEKLLLGLAWYGYDWNLTAGGVVALRHPEAMTRAQNYNAVMQYDGVTQTPHFTYEVENQQHEVWFEDARSNDAKLNLVFQYGLAGAAGWRMGHEDRGVWALFRNRLGFQTWYLAEGSTATPYHTWILLQNPNPLPVSATVTFMKEDGTTPSFKYQLKPNSRFSIFANEVIPNAAFSTKVEADAPIIVERAMYFGYGGHDTTGVNAPSRQWYLPQGSSVTGTHTWILLMNPNPAPTTARVTFMRPDGSIVRREFTIKPTARLNVFANQYILETTFATSVDSDLPIVAEWASYFDGGKAGNGSSGSSFTARRWYLAEGFTSHTVSLALMNPSAATAQATLTFMLEGGQTVRQTVTLKPTSQQVIVANQFLPPSTAFSTLVEADQPIAVERNSQIKDGNGHSAPGVATPAKTWYLAEGSTASPFKSYLLLQNPSSVSTHATVTFMTDGGRNVVVELDLAPHSRSTIDAGYQVPNVAFSTRVDSDIPIVVERAMYFGRGSHASVGVSQ